MWVTFTPLQEPRAAEQGDAAARLGPSSPRAQESGAHTTQIAQPVEDSRRVAAWLHALSARMQTANAREARAASMSAAWLEMRRAQDADARRPMRRAVASPIIRM